MPGIKVTNETNELFISVMMHTFNWTSLTLPKGIICDISLANFSMWFCFLNGQGFETKRMLCIIIYRAIIDARSYYFTINNALHGMCPFCPVLQWLAFHMWMSIVITPRWLLKQSVTEGRIAFALNLYQ
jgi:hypothetical protein